MGRLEFDSPLGRLTLIARAGKIAGLEFTDLERTGKSIGSNMLDMSNSTADDSCACDLKILENAAEQLDKYFSGKLEKFDLPLDLSGTDFQKLVWRALLEIGYSETKSYGEIARSIGRPKAYRAVGNACNANIIPIIIPCHRIVAADNKLGGFALGIEIKKKLLALERAQNGF